MTNPKRPRVATIGLNEAQLASIAPLCGTLRQADSLDDYLNGYPWTETDVVVSSGLRSYRDRVDSIVNLMMIGPTDVFWSDSFTINLEKGLHFVQTDTQNTERELAVPSACPDRYRPLAAELSRHLGRAAELPAVIASSRQYQTALIETTSGHPVALRLVLPSRSGSTDDEGSTPIALLLPAGANLGAWFRAFLCELHESDPIRVPHAPPRLSQPADWYTPEESELADRIAKIDAEIERLTKEREQLQMELAAEGERADTEIRRALWADGDELIAAVGKVLDDLGFAVRDMDAELKQGEPRREDLRLTLQDEPEWQAMVEVKGYTSGTRTNDNRQIREHRDRYIEEKRRPPDLTVWLANPYRRMDPSSRPAPDQNVRDAAEAIGAVHVLAPDLYRQWALVAAGGLDAETVVQSLVTADPGLWKPPALGSRT